MPHYTSKRWADERNGRPIFVNCVAASGVNAARAATNGAIPATDAEVIALRKATGDLVGAEGLRDLDRGMIARYDIHGKRTEGLWAPIETGLRTGNMWFVVIIQLHALPKREWSQPHDVTHAVLFGPRDDGMVTLVDPLRAVAAPRPISYAEAKAASRSGNFEVYGVEEFQDTPHVAVKASLIRPVALYSKVRDHFVRRFSTSVQFTARCTKAEFYTVNGSRRRMIKVTGGSHANDIPPLWLNADGRGIVYTEGE